jgi:hypothetical protein
VGEIAAHYRTHLTTTYPDGPILLGGACTGSLIAIEMAAQLADAGRPIHHLVLLDPNAPSNVWRYVQRSAGIELPPRSSAAMLWRHRLLSLLLLGRASDGTQEADFDDNRLRRLRVFTHRWKIAREARNKGRLGGGAGHQSANSVRAKATLRAAYSHCKPRRYAGSVDIISSRKRQSGYGPDDRLWGLLLPKRCIHTVPETRFHSGLFNAQADETAATLQRCIDRAIDRLQAARAEQA